jgi:LmbE family N-acetylglucosaminyl deacetylase
MFGAKSHASIPVVLPHYRLERGSLYFLASKRPTLTLDAVDQSLWLKIDGQRPMTHYKSEFPDAEDRIMKFFKAGVVEVLQSFNDKPRKKVIVIEPHMDDAALSIGGMMWKRRESHEFNIVSIVGYSNFTSYWMSHRDFFDIQKISQLRRAEASLAARMVGGSHRDLGELDRQLHFHSGAWDLEWFRRHEKSVFAFLNHSPSPGEAGKLAEKIGSLLSGESFDELWIPMGIGSSADHEVTRDTCLKVISNLSKDLRGDIYVYQDTPYQLDYPGYVSQFIEAFNDMSGNLEGVDFDITEHISIKQRMLTIFASQFKSSYMAPKVRASCRVGGHNPRFVERAYRVTMIPRCILQERFYSGRSQVLKIKKILEKWYPKNQQAKFIRILMPLAAGGWRRDISFILQCFPNVTFEIYVTADGYSETRQFVDERIIVKKVSSLGLPWIKTVLLLVISGTSPVIILMHSKLMSVASLVRFVWWWADPLPASNLDHLVQALKMANVHECKRISK